MNRAKVLVVLVAGTVLGSGCGKDVAGPPDRAPSPGIVLHTEAGPVDVLSFGDDGDGFRRLRVHAVGDGGVHAVRELVIGTRMVTDGGGTREFIAAVRNEDATTFRATRRIREDTPEVAEVRLEGAGERLSLQAEVHGSELEVLVEHRSAAGKLRRILRYANTERVQDPVYAASVRQDLTAFYSSGPLLHHPDRRLLEAVLASPDWERYLDPVSGDTVDKTKKRIRQVCAGASAAGLVSCTASLWVPVAWLVCVPATGINIACTAYQLRQAFLPDPGNPCVCPCMCDQSPPLPDPDPDPEPEF